MTQYGGPAFYPHAPFPPFINTGYVDQDNNLPFTSDVGVIADNAAAGLTPIAVNDNDYIKSRENLTTVEFVTFVQTPGGDLVNPNTDTGFTLRLRCRKSVGTDPASYQVTKTLYQGLVDLNNRGTLIASVTSGAGVPPTYTEYTHNLTAPEVALITDYSDLWFVYTTVKS